MVAAALPVYAEDETDDNQFSLGSKECRRAETESRSDVESISPNAGRVSGSRKGNDGDVVGIRNTRDQSKRNE
jgi:hypothetical protein